MKKSLKFIATILLALMLTFTFAQPISFAEADPISTIIDNTKADTTKVESGNATTIAQTVTSWILVISIVVSVVVLMYTGLKFIVGSTQEKAEYKKSLVPLIIGIAIVLFSTTIIKVLFSLQGTTKA